MNSERLRKVDEGCLWVPLVLKADELDLLGGQFGARAAFASGGKSCGWHSGSYGGDWLHSGSRKTDGWGENTGVGETAVVSPWA